MARRPRRKLVAALALALALGVGHAERADAQGAPAATSSSPTPDELQAARELFQEAFQDEQEQRLPEALEKFQRVAKVKETPSVRYRIATVLAAMGRLREARDMYRALAAAKSTMSPSDHETADSAAEKAAELDQRIPKLSLRLDANAPPNVRVTLDGAPVPVSTTPRAIEVDPGEHIIAASSSRGIVSESTVNLPDDGGEVAHTVTFEDEQQGEAAARDDRTLAWVALGVGGALLLGGGALLVAREGAIDDVNESCPLRLCPANTRSDVEADLDRAKLFGPLGATLGVAGLAAVGVGVYLLVRKAPSAPATTTPTQGLAPTARGFVVRF